MKRKPQELPRKGSTPDDLFYAVGSALSFWEEAEDALMGLFAWLCRESEPTLFDVYVSSPRTKRGEMMKGALERYSPRLTADELASIRSAIRELDKLSPTRNEIAHGHVVNYTAVHSGETVMSGAYLLPSLHEGKRMARDPRYAHTAETIVKFREAVREHRWAILQAQGAGMDRHQEARRTGAIGSDMVRSIARHIAEGRMGPKDVDLALDQIVSWREPKRGD